MKKYSIYKPSNIDWLGDIPNEWEIARAKYLGKAIIGLTYSPDEVVNEGEGVLVLRSSNIQNGQIVLSDNVYVKKDIPENLFTKSGDILICSRNGSVRLIGKNALIGEMTEGLSFGAFMTIFRSQFNNFLYYFFNSNLFTSQSGLFSTSTINQLTTSILNNMQIPIPPPDTQRAIVEFLKERTKKIDDLVTKKRKLIDLLREERAAIINQAITKGINLDAEMKDSGIEWLGKIPKHWEIKKLKFLGKSIIGLTYDPSDVTKEDEGVLVLRSTNLQDGKILLNDNVYVKTKIPDDLYTKENDILICSRNGSRKLIGKNAIIGKDASGLTFGAFTTIFRSDYNQFLFYIFNSGLFSYQAGKFLTSTINQLTLGALNNFEIPLPPVSEQMQISNKLKIECQRIDLTKEKIQKEIDLLQEYRTALISEVVTGKIDVRDELVDKIAIREEVALWT